MTAAPVTFITACLLVFGAGILYQSHEDKDHLQSISDQWSKEKQGRSEDKTASDNTKEMLTQRLAAKDDLLTEYRSQLLIAKATSTSPAKSDAPAQLSRAATRFSSASNSDLRRMGIKLAQEIRDATAPVRSFQTGVSGMDVQAYKKAVMEATSNYQNKYEADAVVLHDEMLSRLPLITRPSYMDAMYTSPGNTQVIDQIANDLEVLAKELPMK